MRARGIGSTPRVSARAFFSRPDEACNARLSPRTHRRAAPGRRFFNPCNFAVTRALMALTESLPKVVLFVLIIAETGAASTASVSSYISLALAFVNVVTTGDLVMAELLPELSRVEPPGVDARRSPKLALKELIDRLIDQGLTTAEEIRPEWDAMAARGDELETQLCALLADVVCLKERERVFQIAVVLGAVAITCADTASDVNVTLLYLREGSPFGMVLLVHLIAALVSEGGVGPVRARHPAPPRRACKLSWPELFSRKGSSESSSRCSGANPFSMATTSCVMFHFPKGRAAAATKLAPLP